MSTVKDTIQDVILRRAPAKLADWEALVATATSGDLDIFELDNRKLEDICKVQAQNLVRFSLALRDCEIVEKTVKQKIDELEGELYQALNEGNNRALAKADINQYIKAHPRWISAYEIFLEVHAVKLQLDEVVEAIKALGWMIGHITKLRVAQLQEDVL